MNTDTTATWLKRAAVVVAAVGAVIALGAHPLTAWPVTILADLTLWPLDGAQSLAAPETRLIYGIAGGVMAGWGVMMWLVVDRVWPRDPQTAGRLIVVSLFTWFVIDSTASLAAGAPLNIVVNLGFLAIFLLPLAAGGRLRSA